MADRPAQRIAASAEWLEAVAILLRAGGAQGIALTGAVMARVLEEQARGLFDVAAEVSAAEARRKAA